MITTAVLSVSPEVREREARRAKELQERTRAELEYLERIAGEARADLRSKGIDDRGPLSMRILNAVEKCLLLLVDGAYYAFTAWLVYQIIRS